MAETHFHSLSRKVIIDTDPGIDDALALAFAVACKLDIVGITACHGNVSPVIPARERVMRWEHHERLKESGID